MKIEVSTFHTGHDNIQEKCAWRAWLKYKRGQWKRPFGHSKSKMRIFSCRTKSPQAALQTTKFHHNNHHHNHHHHQGTSQILSLFQHCSSLLNITWQRLPLLGIAWHCLALLGIAWHCLALFSIPRHCSALLGIARQYSALLGIEWNYPAFLSIAPPLLGIAWYCWPLLCLLKPIFLWHYFVFSSLVFLQSCPAARTEILFSLVFLYKH